jgi:hypothetical protein
MSKTRHQRRLGASKKHAIDRLKDQCGFHGDKKAARKFISLCRKKAGKNGWLIISAENLDVDRQQMEKWGIPNDKYYIHFVGGQAHTVLSLADI